MFLLGMVIYVLGGLALYFLTGNLTGLGLVVDSIYTWFFLDSGLKVAVYKVTCLMWSTICHVCWMALFSERSESWVDSLRFQNVLYLFFRMLIFLFLSLLILGVVGVEVAKKPFSDFHQFFSILVPCLLLGGWVWSARDFFIAVSNYKKRDVV
ncbi:hypothetical protein [Pseudomonas syringae]|uniref:hypothetical protein n=1 Tax=Pseudomonas syringae TaxID=317 RepID=UPI000465245E|nr:hypothetical protein [Pseudomonas syringae]